MVKSTRSKETLLGIKVGNSKKKTDSWKKL